MITVPLWLFITICILSIPVIAAIILLIIMGLIAFIMKLMNHIENRKHKYNKEPHDTFSCPDKIEHD